MLTGAKDMVLMVGAGNNFKKRSIKKRPEMDISGVVQQPHLVDNVEDALYLKIVVEKSTNQKIIIPQVLLMVTVQSIVPTLKVNSFNITAIIFKIKIKEKK
ncbi:MAG: hypothetical protein CMB96_06580 [Flavobacteriaceae bacterium]|nr:hypothetical protein [Flavobacteriaceae bacterium]|tara:strand:+ start:2821 stop:3123 length:303 start_codon:yes stop_codon:yes gene_type:complete